MNSITDAQRVTTTNSDPRAVDHRTVGAGSLPLPLYWVNLMRAVYLLMGVGLAVTPGGPA